jgi:curved DNA-binding protein CbpA
MANAPQPIAHGTLDATPLDHVMLSVHRKKLSGTLAVWPDDAGTPGQDRVLFRNGHIAGAKLLEPAAALDRGLLPLFRRATSAYAFYGEDLLGDRSTVVAGTVDVHALVLAAMRGGLREGVVDGVLARFDGFAVRLVKGYEFARLGLLPKEQAFSELLRADPSPVASLVAKSGDAKVARRVLYVLAITHGIEPYEAVEAEAPSAPPDDDLPTLDAPMRPAGANVVTFQSGGELDGLLGDSVRPSLTDVRPSDFPFPDAELSGARISFTDGLPPARTPVPEQKPPTKRSSGNAPRPDPRRVAQAPEPPPPPPEGLEASLAQRWREVSARFVKMDGETYFQMLGVSDICTPDEVRDAYFASVKHWHPDRLPEGLEVLRPFVERIFHNITAARDLLSDEAQRQRYLKTVAQGGGKPSDDRKLEAILTAAGEYERAQVLANRGKWLEVLDEVAICMDLDPENADYVALKAWAVLQKAPLDSKPDAKDALGIAEQALKLTKGAHHERAVFTKAVALQRLGRLEDAHECFKKVAERNPKHLEAAREARLYEMRSRKSLPPRADGSNQRPEGGGLLSKFFGNKKP